jgi:hypothetical protein
MRSCAYITGLCERDFVEKYLLEGNIYSAKYAQLSQEKRQQILESSEAQILDMMRKKWIISSE